VVTTFRYGNAVRTKESPVVLEIFLDTKAPFVHQRVVLRAQQQQLLDRRFATIGPVFDVVDIDKALVAASRETTGILVPGTNRPFDAFGYHA